MNNILEENRSLGWARLPENAPEFVRRFVTEFRTARLEKRGMSDSFLRLFAGEAERRSTTALGRTATKFVNKLFRYTPQTDAEIAKRYGVSLEKVQDIRLQVRAERLGREIAKPTEQEIADFNREAFPDMCE